MSVIEADHFDHFNFDDNAKLNDDYRCSGQWWGN